MPDSKQVRMGISLLLVKKGFVGFLGQEARGGFGHRGEYKGRGKVRDPSPIGPGRSEFSPLLSIGHSLVRIEENERPA